MYAVVDIGGKQWKVAEADRIRVPSLDTKPEKQLSFDRVLLVVDEDNVHIGNPHVSDAKVLGTVLNHGKAEKVTVFKKKRRKDYNVLKGHRQGYTEIRIDSIEFGKAAKPPKQAGVKAAAAKPAGPEAKQAEPKTAGRETGVAKKSAGAAKKQTAAGNAAPKKAAAKKPAPKKSTTEKTASGKTAGTGKAAVSKKAAKPSAAGGKGSKKPPQSSGEGAKKKST